MASAAAIAALVLDLSLPLGVAAGVPYVAPVLISLSAGRLWTLAFAGLGTVLTAVGFYASPDGGIPWMVLTNRLLALFAIWVTAVLSLQRESVQKRLLMSEGQTEVLQFGLRPQAWSIEI